MDLGIKDRPALVTGASKNIGRGIAIALAREGARVISVARSTDGLDALHKEITSHGGRHSYYAIDLMADGGAASLVEKINADFGGLDIMVHNLGGSFGVGAFAPVADWEKVWHFNVGIAHELNRAFIPGMTKKKWGRIVHLSTLSTQTYNGYPAYVSAKCAVDGYVKSVNRQVSKDNVILTAVAPGAIYTEGRFFAKLKKENPAALENYYKEHLPICRLGTPEDIGPVTAFLCSEYAAFMAGSIVGVDGGGM